MAVKRSTGAPRSTDPAAAPTQTASSSQTTTAASAHQTAMDRFAQSLGLRRKPAEATGRKPDTPRYSGGASAANSCQSSSSQAWIPRSGAAAANNDAQFEDDLFDQAYNRGLEETDDEDLLVAGPASDPREEIVLIMANDSRNKNERIKNMLSPYLAPGCTHRINDDRVIVLNSYGKIYPVKIVS